jgi:hypothetical protein
MFPQVARVNLAGGVHVTAGLEYGRLERELGYVPDL